MEAAACGKSGKSDMSGRSDVSGRSEDRRARRSYRLLKQSFLELMREKGFPTITIQDIADRADVNRGTFYAHFPDKYALLEEALRDKFRHRLEAKLPEDAGWERGPLRILVLTVLEHYREMSGGCHPTDVVGPMLERAVQEDLYALLLDWIERSRANAGEDAPPYSSETLALMASWAIYGAAVDWSRGNRRLSAERMADQVMAVLLAGTGRLASEA